MGLRCIPAASACMQARWLTSHFISTGERPFGNTSGWFETLICAVNLVLESQLPTVMLWGTAMVRFDNDAYLPLMAEKHPQPWPKGTGLSERGMAYHRPAV